MKKYLTMLLFCCFTTGLWAQTQSENAVDTSEIYSLPEIPAKAAYPLNTYLAENTLYPMEAMVKKVQGIVNVYFTVERDGSISNAMVLKGAELGCGLPEEALRLARSMPKWEAARIKDQTVRSKSFMPVHFRLPNADTNIYKKVSVPARAPYDWNKYLAQNIQYPSEAKNEGVSANIHVRFVVERDGSITQALVTSGSAVGMGLPEEALRVVRSMPDWEPGTIDDLPVRSYFVLPIHFRVQ